MKNVVNDKYSLIEGTLARMSNGKGANAALANMVLDINLPADAKYTTIANRIAAVYAKLKTDRRLARQAGQQPRHAPEAFGLYFMQQLMNQICWSAQRVGRGITDGETFAEQVWGCDFSQEVLTDDFQMEKIDPAHLSELVDDAFFLLCNVRATFEADMHNYITDIEPLHVFQEITAQEDGTWEVTAVADTYNEAQELMEEAIARLQEAEENKSANVATDTNFG